MRNEMIQYVYNSIELNIQRMIIIIQKHRFRQYTKKKKKRKKKENNYFWRCVLVL